MVKYVVDSQVRFLSGEQKKFPIWLLGLLAIPIIAIPLIKKK